MTDSSLIHDSEPLQTQYIPSQFVDRETVQQRLSSNLSDLSETGARNLHLHGPCGTGKTHLTINCLRELSEATTAYIPCTKARTQYRVLQHLYQSITDETVNSGHHTADLKRRIKERVSAVECVVALDNIEFLLQNDGDDLLYYLSRTQGINTILVSNDGSLLSDQVEERTMSSLQARSIRFDPLSEDQRHQLLHRRAQDSLKPQSLHRAALRQIASKTSNLKFGVHWLKTAAQQSGRLITVQSVIESRDQAYRDYVENVLQDLTAHHVLLHQIISELTDTNETVQTGRIYEEYQSRAENPLSNRRISTYLKHLEHLQLINSEYYYGGYTGKTRKVSQQGIRSE